MEAMRPGMAAALGRERLGATLAYMAFPRQPWRAPPESCGAGTPFENSGRSSRHFDAIALDGAPKDAPLFELGRLGVVIDSLQQMVMKVVER